MKKQTFFAIFLCFFTSMALAASTSQEPVALLEKISNETISKLKANKSQAENNPQAVSEIIETILLPNVDIKGMSRSVVGRNAWKSATSAQQEEFSKQFSHLITNTYVSALQAYTNQTIKFYPIRGGLQAGQNRVSVHSEILQPNGPSIPVDYRLINKNGQWLIYDLIVDGISLLKSYKQQFATPLQNGGMAQLITDIQSHNKKTS